MERNYKPIDWSNFPPIEKCTPTDGADYCSRAFVDADNERVITLDISKLAIPTSGDAQKCAMLAELNAKKASSGENPIAKAI